MVRDHGRQRDGGDDDHRGGRGKPAEKRQQHQKILIDGHRQRQHEHVRIGAFRQYREAADGNWQHEQAHQQQIGREQPGGHAQLVLAGIFHHGDLELARQADNRDGGQEGERNPACIEHIVGLQDTGCIAAEDVGGPVRQCENHEQPDSDEGEELHQGFQRDGGDHTMMALVRVDCPCAENDSEERHPGGDPERHVDTQGVARRAGQVAGIGIDDHLNAGGHRLELQGDVGRGADHRDQGHQNGKAGTLTITRGNQIGDRGDPVHVSDPDQLAQQEPPAHENQSRAEIDGGEFEPAAHRGADGAVEGPGSAVDRDREGVDDRRLDPGGLAAARLTVPQECDHEEQRHIGERGQEDQVRGKHQRPGEEISAGAFACGSGSWSLRENQKAITVSAVQRPKT